MSSADESSSQHLARLDILRAAAFIAVFCFHVSMHFFRLDWVGLFRDYSTWPKEILVLSPVAFGWLGVALFFVISGFCIHLSYLRRPASFTVQDFYFRRFARIYPAYLVSIVACLLLMPWIPSRYMNFFQIPAHLLFIHNFIKASFFGINSVYWSLGVEFQFYLLYPLLLQVRRRFGLPICFIGGLVLNLVCSLYFVLSRSVIDPPISTIWGFPLVTWCDWILGACLAEAYVKKERLFRREGLWLAISFVLLVMAVQVKTLNVQAFLFAAVFFGVLMQCYLAVKTPPSRIERLLVPVGLVSYSLYLWHQPIISLAILWSHHLFSSLFPQIMTVTAISVALLIPISVASYYYLEVNARRALIAWHSKGRFHSSKRHPLIKQTCPPVSLTPSVSNEAKISSVLMERKGAYPE